MKNSKVLANQKIIRIYQHRSWYLEVILFFILVGFVLWLMRSRIIYPCPDNCINPVIKTIYTVVPLDEMTIEDQIKITFGKYSDKAFTLLQGKECAENRSLNPKAHNINNDIIRSEDFGVFQINNHWQGVSNTKFLYDPTVNIQMAWKIFKDSGYSFKMWTCGKYYNI